MKENIEEDITRIENFLNEEIRFEVNTSMYNTLKFLISDYKRVLKENEEYLNAINISNKEKEDWIKAYQEEKDKQFELIQNTNNTIKTANIAIKDLQEKLKEVIPVQKIKDKIEELKNNKPYLMKFDDWRDEAYTNEDIINNCIEVLQELVESEEK